MTTISFGLATKRNGRHTHASVGPVSSEQKCEAIPSQNDGLSQEFTYSSHSYGKCAVHSKHQWM